MTTYGSVRFARRLTLALVFVVFAFAATVTAADARRPGPTPSGGASCTLSSTGAGQPLILSGSGFAPNSQYLLFTSTPGGSGATTVNTDPSGAISDTLIAYWSGTYTAGIWSEGHHSSEVAACSTTVP